jgi:hypothetical protein
MTKSNFVSSFGPKRQRKRPKIAVGDLTQLVQTVQEKEASYDETKDSQYQVCFLRNCYVVWLLLLLLMMMVCGLFRR